MPERIKIENVENLAANLHNVVHIRNLKQALNHGLVFKKVLRVTNFNQEALLKPLIDVNTELKNAKKTFPERFFQVHK